MDVPRWIWFVATLVAFMSALSFAQYAIDKHRARRGRRRIPEARLLLVDLLAGWPGGMCARHLLRHKTVKPSFRVRFALVVVLNVAIVSLLVWRLASVN